MGEMAMSRKRKRELIENSFNRWTADDDATALPDWFIADEKVHMRPDSGPSVEGSKNKELIQFYRERAKSANVRSIKKVAEARHERRRNSSAGETAPGKRPKEFWARRTCRSVR